MKFTINTEVLSKNNLTLGDFLVMLMGYHNIDYEHCYRKLVESGLVEANLFSKMSVILSDNSKNLVAKILMESDDRAVKSNIDFNRLAEILQGCYPEGIKSGTTYSWKGSTEEIAQKLRTLVVKYNFVFTVSEALNATIEYVSSFNDRTYMKLLKYFILKTTDDGQGHKEIDSMLMTIIENNRKKNEEKNEDRLE